MILISLNTVIHVWALGYLCLQVFWDRGHVPDGVVADRAGLWLGSRRNGWPDWGDENRPRKPILQSTSGHVWGGETIWHVSYYNTTILTIIEMFCTSFININNIINNTINYIIDNTIIIIITIINNNIITTIINIIIIIIIISPPLPPTTTTIST